MDRVPEKVAVTEAPTVVDCRGCTACCSGQMVALTPNDPPFDHSGNTEIEWSPVTQRPERVLKLQANGDCTYLRDGACSIYASRPAMCRAFSCVRLVEKIVAAYPLRADRRRLGRSGILDQAIFAAGMERLEESKRPKIEKESPL